MLLAIDVGNSNVKFALLDGRTIIARWKIDSDENRSSDAYAQWLIPLMKEHETISAMIISTVVPNILGHLQSLARDHFNVEPIIARNGTVNWGIAVNVDNPASVGTDRLVNAIGAHEEHEGDLIVVSLGTATTIDHIGDDGSYNGGLIAPGMALSRDALATAAAQLPYIELKRPFHENVIGKNTDDQILIGLYWGYFSLIEGLVNRMKAEIDKPLSVIATGGLSALFQRDDALFDIIDSNLTLKGLAILYNRQP